MTIHKGQKAPDFTLFDSDTQKVSLSDYKGKNVVLLFFPFAFSGVCTQELCGMRDELKEYNHLNAEVIAISVDSPFTLARFKKEENYNFPLLSDFNKETAKSYGALYDEFLFETRGVAKRSAFVIDKDGLIQYAEVLEDAHDLPDFNAIKARLQELS